MNPNIYELSKMTKEQYDFIMKRAELDITEQMKVAKEVSDDVKARGDEAVLEYTAKFDRVQLTADKMKVTPEEIEAGYNNLDKETREAIEYAYKNIYDFHEKQLPEEMWFTMVDDGLMVGEKTTPIVDVCLYVPHGKGSFPSVLCMLGIPAVVIGPGNSYATAAKRVLANHIDAGLPAGPSEIIVLADEKADPEKVALDWMIEAEHGPDSAALLVTHSKELVEKVVPIVNRQLEKISPKRKEFIETNLTTYGGVILTNSLDESIDFVNEYAPEHMEVMTEKPFDTLPKIKNAGEILLGDYTPVTLCNFVLGPNAILPTGGFAKTYSSVSVQDFLKRSSVGYASKDGFENVRDYAYRFAKVEGFDTHGLAVKERK